MADIVHKTLPASECHEAPQIISATTVDAGQVITPSSSTSGEGELRYLESHEVKDSTQRLLGLSTQTLIVDNLKASVLVLAPIATQVVTVQLGSPAIAVVKRVTITYGADAGGEIVIQNPLGTINGLPSVILRYPHNSVTLVTDGADWYLVATNVIDATNQYALLVAGNTPVSLSANIKTKLVVNPAAAGGFFQESLPGFASRWDTAQNRLSSEGFGASYYLSLRGTLVTSSPNSYIDIAFEEGSGGAGTGTLYQEQTVALLRDTGVENNFAVDLIVYTSSGFAANGLEVYLTAKAAMTLTSVALIFERSRLPN